MQRALAVGSGGGQRSEGGSTKERRNGADTDSGRWTALRLGGPDWALTLVSTLRHRGTDRALMLDNALEARRNGAGTDIGQH